MPEEKPANPYAGYYPPPPPPQPVPVQPAQTSGTPAPQTG